MPQKKLSINPLKCTGCCDCETACARKHTSTGNPENARIRIISDNKDDGFYLPSTCQHCENPPCMAVCPQGAIFRDAETDAVKIDKGLCIGCKMCVSACPFGAMDFDENLARAYKCDLCDGAPECVRVCEAKALDYVDDNQLNYHQLKKSSVMYYHVVRRMAA